MKNAAAILALASLFALAACGGAGKTPTSAPSEGPGASASAAPAAGESEPSSAPADAGSASSAPDAAETPGPTPTPNANLLSVYNGTRVVAYPAKLDGSPDELVIGKINLPDGAACPCVVTFELPTTEHIESFTLSLDGTDGPKRTATVAVSTSGADTGFTDAGSASSASAETAPVIKAGVSARWVRVTWNAPDAKGWEGISAAGTAPGPRTGAPISGVYVEHDNPYKDGKDIGSDATYQDPWLVRAVSTGAGMTFVHCYATKLHDDSPGTSDGRTFDYQHSGSAGHVVINDEGTIVAGEEGGNPVHYNAFTGTIPSWCSPEKPYGNGKTRVLVLDSNTHAQPYPLADVPKALTKYRFTRMQAGFLTEAALAGADEAILNSVCLSSEFFNPTQGDLLNTWISDGHKLLILNADTCSDSAYSFLPYQFTTSNPGGSGAHGDTLVQVENDDLGSSDKTETKRFVDTVAYSTNRDNQLGDTNIVTTKDPHWCGHLFGTNSNNVNGFIQIYAPYGKGLIIFNGFDYDDNAIAQYQQYRDFELDLSLPADLPCSIKAGLPFVLEPNREGTFVAGKAQSLPFDMAVLANQGWKGHVDVATTGDFKTTITPASFDMSGGVQALKLDVAIPATTKAGTYAVTVTATDPAGDSSTAVIQFNGEAPLKTIPKKQQRIRLYGIHFDTASAKIQPRSEPVIKEIADLMNGDKTLRFQVEGHTDSDGGAAYNLALSQARAKAVVSDLIHRYHIAASRLVPKGFGLTKPVASNDTAGGKALNRRVELLRL